VATLALDHEGNSSLPDAALEKLRSHAAHISDVHLGDEQDIPRFSQIVAGMSASASASSARPSVVATHDILAIRAERRASSVTTRMLDRHDRPAICIEIDHKTICYPSRTAAGS
jgi:hypothetical protein